MVSPQQLNPHEFESRQCTAESARCDKNAWQCPSCRDGMDLAHQVACRCGYRVCQSCWQIAANFGGACPSCGAPPSPPGAELSPQEPSHALLSSSPSSSSSSLSSSSSVCRLDSSSSSGGSTISRSASPVPAEPTDSTPQQPQPQLQQQQQRQQNVFIRGADRRTLQNLRVVQRTLVYAIGLSPGFSQTTTLKQPGYFGQYGEITKLVINHHQGVSLEDPRYGSASAYITFRRQEDAWAAICSVDGFRVMGRTIRASFGTTKYCNSFLRNLPCNNPECLYLHHLGNEEDRFTKDEVQLGLARHGSSFAFKEEVLGDRHVRSSSHTHEGEGAVRQAGWSRADASVGATTTTQPANPVLPPPCPVSPPLHSQQSFCRPSGAATAQATAGIGASQDEGWTGAQPSSPLPLGADGRSRPRRRRGQRGRRGGGGGGGNAGGGGASSGAGTVESATCSGFCGRTGNGSSAVGTINSGAQADAPFGFGNFYPVGACHASRAQAHAAGRYGPSAPSTFNGRHCNDDFGGEFIGTGLDPMGQEKSTVVGKGMSAAPGMKRTPASPGAFHSSDSTSPLVPSVDSFHIGGGSIAHGNGGNMSSRDLYHPLQNQVALHHQQQVWTGSDPSSSSSCRNRSGNGKDYWNSGFGLGALTPETLAISPPTSFSRSDVPSPLPFFRSIDDVNTQGLWNPRRLRKTTTTDNFSYREGQEAGPGAVASSMYTLHRSLQVSPAPAFLGMDDGQGQQQQLQDAAGNSTLDKNQSHRLRQLHQRQQQQQQPQRQLWNDIGEDAVRYSSVQHIGQQQQSDAAACPTGALKGSEHGAAAADGITGGPSLFSKQRPLDDNDSNNALNDRKVPITAAMTTTPSGQPPQLPQGLGFPAEAVVSRRPGSFYSDDISSISDHLAAFSWEDDTGGVLASWGGSERSIDAAHYVPRLEDFQLPGEDNVAGRKKIEEFSSEYKRNPWAPSPSSSFGSFDPPLNASVSQVQAPWQRGAE